MKKTTAAVLAALLAVLFAMPAFAEHKPSDYERTYGPFQPEWGGTPYAVDVRDADVYSGTDETRVFALRNQYFRENYNELFEISYLFYQQFRADEKVYKERTDFGGKLYSEDRGPGENAHAGCIYANWARESETHFVMLILNSEAQDGRYTENNRKLLDGMSDKIKEILYVGDTTPCAIVAAKDASRCGIDFAGEDGVLLVTECFQRLFYGDPIYNERSGPAAEFVLTAKGARHALRIASKLERGVETASGYRTDLGEAIQIYLYYDVDRDDTITAADARHILRMAARLEPRYQVMCGNGISYSTCHSAKVCREYLDGDESAILRYQKELYGDLWGDSHPDDPTA